MGTTLGIDIGGTSVKMGFVGEDGRISHRFVMKMPHTMKQEDTARLIGERVNEEAAKLKRKIDAIGIGCPGIINAPAGACEYAANLNWNHLPIVGILQEVTGVKRIRISNDANVAMLGEAKFGAGKGKRDIVLITLGTGVGGGLFLNGQLYEGGEGKGAEIGHMLLVMNGQLCTCGERGCLEAYCSVSALIRDTMQEMQRNPKSLMWDYVGGNIDNVSGFTAFECAKKGDATAMKVVDQYVSYLGTAIINIINIFRPEMIIIGGGLSGQKDYLIGLLDKFLAYHHYGFGGDLAPKPEILVSELGNDAGIIGAACLVMEEKA
jgi:glucokinase